MRIHQRRDEVGSDIGRFMARDGKGWAESRAAD